MQVQLLQLLLRRIKELNSILGFGMNLRGVVLITIAVSELCNWNINTKQWPLFPRNPLRFVLMPWVEQRVMFFFITISYFHLAVSDQPVIDGLVYCVAS